MGQIALPAAIAMQAGSGILQAAGESRALGHRANEAARAARAGKTAAAETDTSLREEIRSVVGNIRAIRASAGIRPDSPTTQVLLDRERDVSERERRIRVGNITAQAEEDERSSKFLRRQAGLSFLYGSAGAIGGGFSRLAAARR